MGRSRQIRSPIPRQGRVAWCVFAALLLSIPSTISAGDGGEDGLASWTAELRAAPPSFSNDLRQRPVPRAGILQQHVNSRLHAQFEDLAAYQVAPAPGIAREDWVVRRMLAETAADRARRGTRRGLEDFLRANTPVGAFIERLDRMNPLNRWGEIDPIRRLGQTQGAPSGQRRESKFDVGVGFNHLTPGLEMNRPVGKGSIRTMVDVLGWVELEYVHGGLSGTRFHVAYDARYGEAVMSCRLGF